MHFGRFPRKTLLAATLLLAFSSANASFVEQIGTPVTPLAVMGTYAADATIKSGLKAVIPAGWQLFQHQSVEMPAGLSWEKDDTWVSTLNKFASKNDIAILIDWDKKAVFFRSTALALQEQEKRQMIAQAASTPLPAFKKEAAAVKPAEKAVIAPVADAVPAPAHTVPASRAASVAQVAPTVTTVAPTLARTATPAVSAPVASAPVTTAQVAAILPAPAPAVQPSLVAAPAPVVAEPVAAPAVKPVVKPSLTRPALRPAVVTPVVAPAAAPAAPVAVTPASAPAAAPVATAAQPQAPVVAAPVLVPVKAPVTAAVPVTAPIIAPAAAPVAAQAPIITAPAPVATPGAVAFNREPVSKVVAVAGAKHGYTVSWEAPAVDFQGPVTLLGADMGEDMNLVLRALGGRRAPVSITVYRESNVVVVREAVGGNANVAFTEVPFSGLIREVKAPKVVAAVAPSFAPAAVMAPMFRPVTAAVAVPVVAPLPVVRAPVVAASTAAPAPVVKPAATPVQAAQVVAPIAAPTHVVPEPARLATAVDTVKKMEPAKAGVAPDLSVVTLHVPAGGSLRDAIENLLEPGWTLKWELSDGLEAKTTLHASGESLVAVLNSVLPRLKLSADVYKPSKLVVVREADAALDK